jgi:hypothetical protein
MHEIRHLTDEIPARLAKVIGPFVFTEYVRTRIAFEIADANHYQYLTSGQPLRK